MIKIITVVFSFLFLEFTGSIITIIEPKNFEKIQNADTNKNAIASLDSILCSIPSTNIGHEGRSGRVSCFSVYENDPKIIYVGSASGGVFKTSNGGLSFKAVFDREGSSSIGAVSVSQQNPDIVWVGTGESWPRNTVSWGDGIYRSIDGGGT